MTQNLANKTILDCCCGSRMFWFDKTNPNVVFADIRQESHTLCDGRALDINPDIICDFRTMPFPDNHFSLVVFDPPHLTVGGENGWQVKKYGKLGQQWERDLKQGFDECMRVLKPTGILIFKWNAVQVPVSKIIETVGYQPLIGHKSGKNSLTHWMTFMKMQ